MSDYLNRIFFKFVDYFKIHQNTYIILLSVFIGVFGGFGAIGFRALIQFFQDWAVGSGELLDLLRTLPWYYKLILPSIGGLAIGPLVYFFAKEAKGHGVPEVMEAVALRGGVIRPRVVIVKALASAINLGTGGSVGREGPIVQIGSAFGSTLGQLLKLSRNRIKTLVACGAAAGIAGTFNSPIAGVLFAVEIILGNFAIHTFSPIVVSSVLSTVVSRHYLGNSPAFIVPHYQLVTSWELILYLFLGVILSGVGILYMNAIEWMEDAFDKLRVPEYLKPALGFLGMGVLICFFPYVFGNGYETITLVLSAKMAVWILVALIPIKILATSLTLGAGGSGGIFAPSLFIGAVTGGAFGAMAHALFPSITATSGAYAMVGMGALVAAVTHAPVTSIIILFELTGDYKIILPLMFSCIIATMLTSSFRKDSIYTSKLSRRGVDLNIGLESTIMKQHSVRDVMHVNVQTIDPDMPFENLFNYVLNSRNEHFYVVCLDGEFFGEICHQRLIEVMKNKGIKAKLRARDLASKTYPKIHPDASLMDCVRMFGIHGVEEMPVVNPETGEFIGVITYRDIFSLYNREILRQGSLGLKFVTGTEETPRNDFVNIPLDYQVELFPVIGDLAGHSIKELDIRNRFNINIVAIRPQDGRETSSEIPTPDRVLTRDDVLILIGKKEDLARFRKTFQA